MGQIGTIKIQTQKGTRSIPVFSLGDSGSSVYEYWRVNTPGGTGFIPLASTVDANFSEIRMQTPAGILAVHDSSAFTSNWPESFEDGNTDGWQGSNKPLHTDHAFDGSYSLGSAGQGTIDAETIPSGWKGGKQVDNLHFYWWETSSQTGHGVRFRNSNGNEELVVGTENPQWFVTDNGGKTQIYGGDGYQRWIVYHLDFNWSNNEYTYTFKDLQSGTGRQGTRTLQQGVDIERVEIDGGGYGSADRNRFDLFEENVSAPSYTPPAVVVDDFNDGDVSEYNDKNGSGISTTTDSYEGSHAGHLEWSGTYYSSAIATGITGPSRGDKFEFYFKRKANNSSTSYGIFWCVSGGDFGGGYFFRISPNDGAIQLHNNGRSNRFATSSWTTAPSSGEWHRAVIEFDTAGDGTIKATIYDSNNNNLVSVQGNDNSHDSGGIGFVANDKGQKASWNVDNVRII